MSNLNPRKIKRMTLEAVSDVLAERQDLDSLSYLDVKNEVRKYICRNMPEADIALSRYLETNVPTLAKLKRLKAEGYQIPPAAWNWRGNQGARKLNLLEDDLKRYPWYQYVEHLQDGISVDIYRDIYKVIDLEAQLPRSIREKIAELIASFEPFMKHHSDTYISVYKNFCKIILTLDKNTKTRRIGKKPKNDREKVIRIFYFYDKDNLNKTAFSNLELIIDCSEYEIYENLVYAGAIPVEHYLHNSPLN